MKQMISLASVFLCGVAGLSISTAEPVKETRAKLEEAKKLLAKPQLSFQENRQIQAAIEAALEQFGDKRLDARTEKALEFKKFGLWEVAVGDDGRRSDWDSDRIPFRYVVQRVGKDMLLIEWSGEELAVMWFPGKVEPPPEGTAARVYVGWNRQLSFAQGGKWEDEGILLGVSPRDLQNHHEIFLGFSPTVGVRFSLRDVGLVLGPIWADMREIEMRRIERRSEEALGTPPRVGKRDNRSQN